MTTDNNQKPGQAGSMVTCDPSYDGCIAISRLDCANQQAHPELTVTYCKLAE